MNKQFSTWFILSAGVILALTGAAKLWSALGSARVLGLVDPITGITFRQLFVGVGMAEIIIALVCFRSRRPIPALALVAWLSTVFLIYRLGLWWMGWHGPCSCLGNLTDALHISPQAADNIMKAVLAYLLVSSYTLLCSRSRFVVIVGRKLLPSTGWTQRFSGWLPVGLIAFSFSTSAGPNVPAKRVPQFTAEAEIVMQEFDPRHKLPVVELTGSVLFSSGDGEWHLQFTHQSENHPTLPIPSTPPGTLIDIRRIPDGTREFSIFPLAVRERMKTDKATPAANAYPIPFPPSDRPHLFLPWLTLCPRPELPLLGSKRIERVFTTEALGKAENEGAFALEYVQPQGVFLSRLCITNPTFPTFQTGLDRRFQPDNQTHQDAYLETDYQILETTNVSGIAFPLRSVIRQYSPVPYVKSASGRYLVDETRLNVTRIDVGSATLVFASLPQEFLAADARPVGLKKGRPANYMMTNDQWVALTNRRLQRIAETFRNQRAKSEGRVSPGRRVIVLAALIGLGGAPLIVACIFFIRKKQRTPNK